MVYDDEPGRPPHLSLPLETTEELAERMACQPQPLVIDAIVMAVGRRTAGRNRTRVSPSRIKSDLRRTLLDVTVEQVAWVMMTVMGLRTVAPRRR